MRNISIDECVETIGNRFELVRVASERAKQLHAGFKPLVHARGEKNIKISMREIATGRVYFNKNETKN